MAGSRCSAATRGPQDEGKWHSAAAAATRAVIMRRPLHVRPYESGPGGSRTERRSRAEAEAGNLERELDLRAVISLIAHLRAQGNGNAADGWRRRHVPAMRGASAREPVGRECLSVPPTMVPTAAAAVSATPTTVDADVLIVGCGPAGLVTALELHLRGLRVLLIDRQLAAYPLPRAVCLDHESYRILMVNGLEQRTQDIFRCA